MVRGLVREVGQPIAEADASVRRELATEGFGVLTTIDVAATLREKLGVERPPLLILGACNPQLAHRALETDPSASLLLPCNVVLEALGGGRTRVSAVDPRSLFEGDALATLAQEASDRLARALDRLGAPGPETA